MPTAAAAAPKPKAVWPGSEFSPDELQKLVYLRATGKISEAEALEKYDALLRRVQRQSICTKILRELFPSLGL